MSDARRVIATNLLLKNAPTHARCNRHGPIDLSDVTAHAEHGVQLFHVEIRETNDKSGESRGAQDGIKSHRAAQHVQHTPGPWTVVEESNDRVIRYSDGQLVSFVARIYDTTLCPEHGTVDANARLIAAAPRMYEFLERLCEGRNDYDLPDFLAGNARAILSEIEGGAR